MEFIAQAEVRKDNGGVLSAILSKEEVPTTMTKTEDSVQITRQEFFRIDLDSAQSFWGWPGIVTVLVHALCVLIKIGLTAEHERALAERVPALKLTPR